MGLGNATVWVYARRDRFAKAWDHAGAMLLFEETGGSITDVLGRPIDLTAGRTMSANFGFVAAPEGVHGRVLEAVHEVLREQGHAAFLQRL
ncbi:3'(2'),5'-bisphosphate nucleotidase [Tolypocladium paradoxum]|uniref:3'(2'),5'-bisphosphate nucleotidase n=1 Tax=Tolypocladium paradoxum TaxID=94208 RepID=A0A2S4KUJ0_9HYPO|nr:3'(2'),5'-bisphosphate nucleotidase [Tolypocladium paradoxum]